MQPWCLFGFNQLFPDLVDLIHSNGGYLARAVLNVPDPPGTGHYPPRDERLARYDAWLRRTHPGHALEVVPLDDFVPDPAHLNLVGFRVTALEDYLQRLRARFPELLFPALIHPHASVSSFARLDEGVLVMAMAVIAAEVELGDFSFVGRGCTIGHDTRLEPFAKVLTGVHLASAVTVGRHATVGIGATVIERRKIGAQGFVAAGAVVLDEVEPGMLVAGVPARPKKRLVEPE